MAEYTFGPLPKSLVDELNVEVTSILGDPDEMSFESPEACENGIGKIWQQGDEDELCVIIYHPNKQDESCAHVDGVDPESPLGQLCQRIIDQGYGDQESH